MIRDEIKVLAGEALSWFERRKRHDGTEYWAIEEGAPKWVHDLAWEAHDRGEILPEDYRYLFILEALEALMEDTEEPETMLEPDVYTSELLAWLNAYPSYRINIVDEAVSDIDRNGLFNALQAGQLKEKQEVLEIVRAFLERKIEEGED